MFTSNQQLTSLWHWTDCDLIPQRLFSRYVCASVCMCLCLRPTNSWQVWGIGQIVTSYHSDYSADMCVRACVCVYVYVPSTADKFEALSGLITSYHSDYSAGICECVYVSIFTAHQQQTSLRHCLDLWPHTIAIIQQVCVCEHESVSVFIFTSHQQLTNFVALSGLVTSYHSDYSAGICVWVCVCVYLYVPSLADKFVALSGLVTSYHSDYSAGMCVWVCVCVNVYI